MTAAPITTIPAVCVDPAGPVWNVADDDGWGAAFMTHAFDGGGTIGVFLPRRMPADFSADDAVVNVAPSAVVRWCTFADHLKADVVFTRKPDDLYLWFAVSLTGILAVPADGALRLVDSDTGHLVGLLPRPYLVDADGARHDLDWVLDGDELTCQLPDLDPALYVGAVFDPTTIDTSTSATPTRYSNQRHVDRFPDSTLFAVFASTSSNGELWKSTDHGSTWAQIASADIAGWTSGSIYVDADGYIHVVWKQSGTGGSRTDGYLYYMRGTPNGDKTAVTWGSAHAVAGGDTRFTSADLVAHAEGTGWKAHIVTSFTAALTETDYVRLNIASGGTVTQDTSVKIGGTYGTGLDHAPTIAFDPSTKTLCAVWSAGTTGSGNGVRLRIATYSAGSWTWNTERQIDTGVYVNSEERWLNVVWDGTHFVLGGFLYTGAADVVRLWERDLADTGTNTLESSTPTGPNALYYGSLAFDDDENAYLFGRNAASTDIAYHRWTRGTDTFESRTQIETSVASGTPFVSSSRLFRATTIDFIYSLGSGSPYNVRYDKISFNTAPTAATWVTSAGAKDVGAALDLDWTFNDPDAGDTQSAYALKRDIGGTIRWWDGSDWDATTETWVTTTTTIVTLASGWAAGSDAQRSYYVKTKDAAGLEAAAYSSALVVTPSAKVNPALDEPDHDDTVGSATLNAEWTVAEQTEYRVRLLSDASAELWTSGWVADSAARVRTIGYTLVNGTDYKVELTTKNNEGLESDADTNDISVSYTPPGTPTLTFDTSDDLKIVVHIANPAGGGGTPATVSNDLHRRLFGEAGDGIRVAADIAKDGSHDDVYVGHLEDFEYRAEAIAANGTRTYSAWTH